MKRAFLLFLVSLMVLMSFSGCDLLENVGGGKTTEITDPNTPETFTYQGMSITLPGDFSTDGKGVFTNGTYRIRAYQTHKSSITPAEGYAFPTLQEYYHIILDEKATLRIEDGVLCTDFNPAENSLAIYAEQDKEQFMTFYETEVGFWIISFYADANSVAYEDIQPQAIEWLKTLSFKVSTSS